MIVEIPILVQPRVDAEQQTGLYAVRPLFFDTPEIEDRDLSKATSRLERELRSRLRDWARLGNHAELATCTFSPHVSLHWMDLRLELRRGMVRCRFPLATFRHDGRSVAFSPYLGDLWFEIETGAGAEERATAVFMRYFRDLEKQQDAEEVERQIARFQVKKKPWLSVLELEVDTRLAGEKSTQQFALLGEDAPVDGEEELRRLGCSLNELYPDQLARAVQRDPLVQQLCDLLAAPDNRPVLLVGGSLVGKTTLIHEAVFRDMERRGRERPVSLSAKRHVWQLAPQRLVTGMSFVGQWENRWLAILRHARKKRHVLYFDDLLGLFQAGITSQSNLSAADVLKPYIERREIRLLAEMTPEQLRVFRERDRGFADMFHILAMEEPDEEATLRILLGVMRSQEARFGTQFDMAVLPTVLDLARHYQPDAAFPGKAAIWLRQLAVKYQGSDVRRKEVIDEFRAKSGLQLAFLDTGVQLLRKDIIQSLRSRIIGQQEAVHAMADVVTIAKARLNDPHRPLGSLFFLGPTGVGKTECAKAFAEFLFTDESRLLRFDMNEFVSPYAAARLAGTFDQPEGLLTGAVRRQPFCVLLFDEIEKAHPDVFDLLLQILGEARLTDALGRTADFSNAVVILTSNLGTRESSRELGFGTRDETASDNIYTKAVREFFRPEFFNRLDRIVPFQRLKREELEQIARHLIDETMNRQGLLGRKCVVDITAGAIGWVIDRGYDPLLGARAMRRSVEHELVSPLARQLAAVLPETPTVLQVSRRESELAVQVTSLDQAEPRSDTAWPSLHNSPENLIAAARHAIDRILRACEAWRPPGEISANGISPEFVSYLGMVELGKDARALLREIAEGLSAPKTTAATPWLRAKPRGKRLGTARLDNFKGRRVLKELQAAQDVNEYCKELAAELRQASRIEDVERHWLELLDQLAFLDAMKPDAEGWRHERVLLIVRSPDADPQGRRRFTSDLLRELSWCAGVRGITDLRDTDPNETVDFGLETAYWPPAAAGERGTRGADKGEIPCVQGPSGLRADLDVVVVKGHHAFRLSRLKEGTYLVVSAVGRLHVYQVIARPMNSEQTVDQVLHETLVLDESCREAITRGETPGVPGPFAWQPVVTLTNDSEHLHIDFRAGRPVRAPRTLARLLPLPPEFQD